MAYTIIHGSYTIFYPEMPKSGPEPDGDTLKFIPDDPSIIWKLPRLSGRSPNMKKGKINIRFEGIDALETHFKGSHQNLKLAYKARDFLLKQAGFGKVEFWEDLPNKVKKVENNPVRGAVLSNGIDSNGRVIGFVFGDDQIEGNDREIYVTEQNVKESFNFKLIEVGLAYPMFYSSLPLDLRLYMREVTSEIRRNKKGLWEFDACNVESPHEQIDHDNIEELCLWPKIFRRLTTFFGGGFRNLNDFIPWLKANTYDKNDKILLPENQIAYLHNIFDINNNGIKLKYYPEDIVILPR